MAGREANVNHCNESEFADNCLFESLLMSFFHIKRFAFATLYAPHNRYMYINNELPHSLEAKAPRVTLNAWRCVMKFFSRMFARRDSNLTTALERQRLGKTMPGQTAAIAGTRLGILV
jgi:hypothetical protein